MENSDLISRKDLLKKAQALLSFDGKEVVWVRDDVWHAPSVDPVHAAGGCYCRECLMWSEAAPKDFMERHPDYSGGWCSELRQGECSGDNTGCWMSVKKDNPFLQLQGEEDGK